jgi:hypothetical protein
VFGLLGYMAVQDVYKSKQSQMSLRTHHLPKLYRYVSNWIFRTNDPTVSTASPRTPANVRVQPKAIKISRSLQAIA